MADEPVLGMLVGTIFNVNLIVQVVSVVKDVVFVVTIEVCVGCHQYLFRGWVWVD